MDPPFFTKLQLLLPGALVDGTSTMLDYSKYILPTGIFLFKFLEWWYSENQNLVTQQQPIPPPPEPPKVSYIYIYGYNILSLFDCS